MNKMNKNNIYKSIKMALLPAFLLMMLLVISSCDTDETQTVTTFTKLVMADEFETEGAPNKGMWTFDIGRGPNGDGWGNQELQYYTDRTENVKVENGFLLITAKEESLSLIHI